MSLALVSKKLFSVNNVRSVVVPLLSVNGANGILGVGGRREASYWNKDWRPGPYPKNEDEMRAAAKRYGMIREDYEPYPDDGMGYGDYPNLPMVPSETRDPYALYEHPELKHHYGEPVHVEYDIMSEDRFNIGQRQVVPKWVMYVVFFGIIASAFLLEELSEQYKFCFVKRMPKQFPGDGRKHYTFEVKE